MASFSATAAGRAAALPEAAITPIVDPASGVFDAVEVTIRFTGDRDGETLLNLPNEWGGEAALYQNLTDLRLTGGRMTMADAPHQRRLRHRPGARLQLRYRIARNEDRVAGAGARINEYRPIVTSRYFHLIGNTIFAMPDSMDDAQRIKVRFGAVPACAILASDLQHAGAGGSVTLRDLFSSITVGGDFTLLDAGGGARIAVHGVMDQRNNEQWRASFQKIAATQRAFWGAADTPYLVTILASPSEPGRVQTGGTGLGDAFAFFATSNADPDQLDQTMTHEYAHSWISDQIGGSDLSGGREAEGYWLSEGFTDYLTLRMMLRAGLWDATTFAAKFNEAVAQHATSKETATPNALLATRFWQDQDAQKMPYLRGMLFAQLLDARLHRSSSATSLDDILRIMHARAAAGNDADAIAQLRLALREAGVDGDALIAQHIDRAEPITLPADAFAPCGTLVFREQPRWELGFDIAATAQSKIVSGVIEGSAAWRAGLRNGMQAGGWSVYSGDVSQPAEVTIVEDGKPRAIRWLPVGDQPVMLQKLELGTEVQSDACRARLGATAR